MTIYNNKNVSTHQTLAASVVDTVNLAALHNQVEVYNAATSNVDIWVRVDGTDPTVAGDDCIRVPAGSAAVIPTPGASTQAKLIASAAVGYSVTGS